MYKAKFADEPPEELEAETCYLIGEKEAPFMAVFLCPCGCKASTHLNLLPETRPRWKLEVHDDETVTFSPSINRMVGCKSHYFMQKGKMA